MDSAALMQRFEDALQEADRVRARRAAERHDRTSDRDGCEAGERLDRPGTIDI